VPIIAVPTTLSAAETTQNAGFKENNKKTGVSHRSLVPRVLLLDGDVTRHTPERLWLSTGMRAVDHSIELLYRPDVSPLLRGTWLMAMRELFTLLPLSKAQPDNVDVRQRLQLAAIASLWPESRKGALGLSHG
jgi:alcohol dehydrogenase class IV